MKHTVQMLVIGLMLVLAACAPAVMGETSQSPVPVANGGVVTLKPGVSFVAVSLRPDLLGVDRTVLDMALGQEVREGPMVSGNRPLEVVTADQVVAPLAWSGRFVHTMGVRNVTNAARRRFTDTLQLVFEVTVPSNAAANSVNNITATMRSNTTTRAISFRVRVAAPQ